MYVAIDIGGTKTILNIYRNFNPESLQFSTLIPTGKNYKDLINKLFHTIDLNCEEKIEGIGISHVGIIDTKKGVCLHSTNLSSFEQQPIVSDFVNKYKTEVKIENDLVCGTLAEGIFGFGKNYENSLYFTASTGIGAGFTYKINKEIKVQQIEAGHFVIKGEGLNSPSGQIDIIESYVGGSSMEIRFLKKPEEIDDLLFWEKQVSYLATALINCIIIFNPRVVILGGGMIENNTYLKNKVSLEVNQQLRVKKIPPIKITEMGKMIIAHGALANLSLQ